MKSYLTGFLLMIFSATASSQNFAPLLGKYRSQFPDQKIHIHFDKENYVSGESIWFKIYIQANGLPAMQNTDTYVEFVSPEGEVVNKLKLPVFWGTATGSIQLVDSLASGYYIVRCYTRWMLNFNDPSIYQQPLYVYHPSALNGTDQTVKRIYSTRFFAEGGNMVNGENNTIAFKATDQFGSPADVAGEILNESDSLIMRFNSIHDGMGKFMLKPKAGSAYHAEIKYEDGSLKAVPLPPAANTNFTLRVENQENAIRISIIKGREKKRDTADVILFAQINGRAAMERHFYVSDGESFFILNTHELPSGILGITLFDKAYNPLAERIVFVNNHDYAMKAEFSTDTINMNKRSLNVFHFSIPDSLEGSYSIAITDDDESVTGSDRNNFVSRFLLSSEIRGYVHDPAYYFTDWSDSIREALDLVMMTNGWRRYNWLQKIKAPSPVIKYTDNNYITIKGRVLENANKKPVKHGELNFFLRNADSTNGFFNSSVDSAGYFELDSMVFFKNADFFFTYNPVKGKKSIKVQLVLENKQEEVSLNADSIPLVSIPGISQSSIDKFKANATAIKSYVDTGTNKNIIRLQEIKIKGKKKTALQVVNERYTSNMFSATAKRTVDLLTNPTTNGKLSILDLIRNNFPEVKIGRISSRINGAMRNTSTEDVIYRDITTSVYNSTGDQNKPIVTVWMDEQQVELAEIREYKSTDVVLMKYFNSFAMSPNNGPALLLYTRRGSDLGVVPSASVDKFSYPGYSYSKEFYSPDYGVMNDLTVPDRRITLLWMPEIIITKESRDKKIVFYNSDDCKRMRVVVEGFDSEGRLCHIERVVK